MTIVVFKVDRIETHKSHTGYERNEDGSVDRSRPTIATYSTVRMSAVVPDVHPEGEHLNHQNYQVWKQGIAASLVMNNVDEAVASGFQEGREYSIDISTR